MNHVQIFISILYIIAILVGVQIPINIVHACSCAQVSEAEQFTNATAVFVGIVENVSEDGLSRVVDFLVNESLKGDVNRNVTVTTGMGDGDCGFNFEVGKSYRVYTYKDDGKLTTGICSGTYEVVQKNTIPASGVTVEATNDDVEKGSSPISNVELAVIAFLAGSLVTWLFLKRKR